LKAGRERWICVAALLVAASGSLQAQAPAGPIEPKPGSQVQAAPPEAKVRVRVTLVNTPVTVRDSSGRMVNNLDVKDFHVTDNGVTQEIKHFDLGGDPLSVVFLVETSSRIEPLLPEIRKTGILLTQTVMGPDGEAALLGFDDGVDKLQDFTTNADSIEETMTRLKEGTSGTRLYDAMATGVEMLSGRPQATAERPGRRRVLFIMAEATDDGSTAKLGEVLRQAQLANVTIFSVGLSTTRAELQGKPQGHRPPTPPQGLPPFPGSVATPTTEQQTQQGADLMALAVWAVQHVKDKVTDHALEIAATATGGAHLPTFKDRSIEKAIDEIGGELHSQYTLTYSPQGTDDYGYHEIKVQVGRKNLKVRSRPGYYLAAPGS
jgi:VWFA-related protein